MIIFVSSKKSSNGKALYSVCLAENERSYFIANEDELQPEWFAGAERVGVCGATSTPMWLMEQVAAGIGVVKRDSVGLAELYEPLPRLIFIPQFPRVHL